MIVVVESMTISIYNDKPKQSLPFGAYKYFDNTRYAFLVLNVRRNHSFELFVRRVNFCDMKSYSMNNLMLKLIL